MTSKRKVKFTEDYVKEFPSIKKGRHEHEAQCIVCDAFVSIAHGGKGDIKKHLDSTKHKQNLSVASTTKKIDTFFVSKSNCKEEEDIAASEATSAFHLVKHHHSYNTMTCTSGLYKKIFKDSTIAQKFQSSKTKSEAIINNVIAPHSVERLKENLDQVSFLSVSTDASNKKYIKIFPIVVQFFSKDHGIKTGLLELDNLENETSETISNYMIKTVKLYNLTSKILAYSGDNTNTNFGGVARKEGQNVFTLLKKNLDIGGDLIGIGCPAHIVHNTIQAGSDMLNVDIEVIICKLYNYFSIYTVRTHQLKELCEFMEIGYQDMLKNTKTRWLTLFPAVERILKMFEPLKSYFLSCEKTPNILRAFFQNPISEVYLWFMHSQMSIFQNSILAIEKEKISIYECYAILNTLKKNLKQRFNANFLSLQVKNLLDKEIITDDLRAKTQFLEDTKTFYLTCIDYIEKWTEPLKEFENFCWMTLEKVPEWIEIEKSLQYMNEKNKNKQINDSVLFDQSLILKDFVERKITEHDNDEIEKKFKDLLASDKWVLFFQDCKSSEQYSELLKLCEFYFCLPSSNANVERIFSLMNRQWSDERNRLLVSSVKSILMVQYNFKEMSCSDFYDYIKSKSTILKDIRSSKKYDWYK